MMERESKQPTGSNIKKHEEIMQELTEIKLFEENFKEYSINEPEQKEERISRAVEESEAQEPPEKIKKKSFVKKIFGIGRENHPATTPDYIEPEVDREKLDLVLIPDTSPISPHGDQIESEEPLLLFQELENQSLKKPIRYTTFRIRFDNDGNLVNVDLRKPKENPWFRKLFLWSKLKKPAASEQSGESEADEKSIFSKIKTGIAKMGRIKHIIPFVGKKQ
jgi:hypothetical protein